MPCLHRIFTARVLYLMLVVLGLDKAPLLHGAAGEPRPMKEWRRTVNERPRRIIFNNDGDEPFRVKNPTVEDLLNFRTTALVGTHVDSIFFCANSSFGTFKRFTKVGQMFTLREGMYANNHMPTFIEKNIDPLRVQLDFVKKNGIEFFASFRMNDNHDGSSADYGPPRLRFNKLKNAHPEYLLGTKDMPMKHGSWAAVNYGRAEIRDIAFSYVEEVCRDYDVDGIELDFFRHPVFFQSTTRGEPATREELEQMTGLIRRIRAMADGHGRARGRPILLAMKLPDSVDYCRTIGLDLDRWLKDDLLDILIPTGYFQLNEWSYSVDLARRFGIKVYPALEESRVREEQAQNLRLSPEGYRGRAALVWAARADGVYLFNAFNYVGADSSLWRELGDPKVLQSLDRYYFASVRGVGSSAYVNFPLTGFQFIETLNPRAPVTLQPGGTATIRVRTAEHPEAERKVIAKLRLRVGEVVDQKALSVSLNGQTLGFARTEPEWMEYAISPQTLRSGENSVIISLKKTGATKLTVRDLMVEVRTRWMEGR